jgi:hypothetical protein
MLAILKEVDWFRLIIALNSLSQRPQEKTQRSGQHHLAPASTLGSAERPEARPEPLAEDQPCRTRTSTEMASSVNANNGTGSQTSRRLSFGQCRRTRAKGVRTNWVPRLNEQILKENNLALARFTVSCATT